MAAFTLDAWNAIIRQINDLIAGGCGDNIEPLSECAVPHLWSVDDVTTVRNKLTEVCNSTFSADTRQWTQAVVDIDRKERERAGEHCLPYEAQRMPGGRTDRMLNGVVTDSRHVMSQRALNGNRQLN